MIMRVHNIMVRNPIVAGLDTPALELAKIMTTNRIGSVIITDGDKLVGIVTERDLVRRVLAEGLDSATIRASSICSKPVISCSEFADLDDVVDIMRDYNIRRIVVIDDDQMLVGILTYDDIVANLKDLSEELARKFLIFSRTRK
ncbi:MAG: CBS domain-containing protein [Candidatus Thorarchaeota archaeon]